MLKAIGWLDSMLRHSRPGSTTPCSARTSGIRERA